MIYLLGAQLLRNRHTFIRLCPSDVRLIVMEQVILILSNKPRSSFVPLVTTSYNALANTL